MFRFLLWVFYGSSFGGGLLLYRVCGWLSDIIDVGYCWVVASRICIRDRLGLSSICSRLVNMVSLLFGNHSIIFASIYMISPSAYTGLFYHLPCQRVKAESVLALTSLSKRGSYLRRRSTTSNAPTYIPNLSMHASHTCTYAHRHTSATAHLNNIRNNLSSFFRP